DPQTSFSQGSLIRHHYQGCRSTEAAVAVRCLLAHQVRRRETSGAAGRGQSHWCAEAKPVGRQGAYHTCWGCICKMSRVSRRERSKGALPLTPSPSPALGRGEPNCIEFLREMNGGDPSGRGRPVFTREGST